MSLNLIVLITIFISLLLTLFLLTVKSKNRLENILLAGFIIACAVDISGIIIAQNLKNKPELYEFIKSFTFLIFPFLLNYVLSICYINFKVKKRHLNHLFPFIFYNLLILCALVFPKSELLLFTLHKTIWIFNTIILKLQALLYLIAIIYVLNRYKKCYFENYSTGNIEIYKWLSRIIIIFLITLPVTIIKDLSVFNNYQEIFNWTILILTVSALIMMSWFTLKALYTPEIFRGINLEIKPTPKFTNIKNGSKSLEKKLSPEDTEIFMQIRKHMVEKEPFVEPTLNLQELAFQMNIPSRKLSILINQHTGQHFFDFINKYRVEKSIEFLEKSAKKEFTIQQIYFEVGFNSKSSFNTAFKKYTKVTPSEYINLLSKKNQIV